MKLLIDENVDVRVVTALGELGHALEWLARSAPLDEDETILRRPDLSRWILVTYDSDFSDLIFNRGYPAPICVIYSRLARLQPASVAKRIVAVLDEGKFEGQLISMHPDGDRYRPFPGREHG